MIEEDKEQMKNAEVVDVLLKYKDLDTGDKPIVIVGPAGNNKTLRVYAYGGLIGEIAINSRFDCKIANSMSVINKESKEKAYSYGKYLLQYFVNGQGYKFCPPNSLFGDDKYGNKCRMVELAGKQYEGLYHYFEEVVTSNQPKKEILCDETYLDLIVSAAKTRFVHKTKEGTEYPQERSIQTKIAKLNMKKPCLDGNMIVVDMESTIKIKEDEKEKNAEIDFVLFDGSSFGLVEFKYRGESMGKNSANSLIVHYDDFESIINTKKDEDKWKTIGELLRRVNYLLEYKLIDEGWKDKINELKEKCKKGGTFDSKLLWCGFYFVESGNKNIENEIELQIKDKIEANPNIVVKYQYSTENNLDIVMTDDIRRVWNKN